ncbi:hypothetical protein PILCRDRAFT_421354 [Piloderma croceum F 1598]|uniref:Uncharacterized protein n=1 Tax=Piloderma croceum (strain F 1598) TaxID=765440 RepID=A0A0C3C325_PILCF|nr:hypothetical protein PILCRDRAFT_421354 [Piloderma croceum F 1598]
MNYDVDGYPGSASYYLQPQTDDPDDDVKYNSKDDEPPTTIISRIRSLFSQTTECNHFDYSNQARVPIANIPCRPSDRAFLDIHHQAEYSPNFPDTTYRASAITPTHKFSDIKTIKTIITDFTVPAIRQVPASFTNHTTSHSRIDSDSSSVTGSGSRQSDNSQSHSASSALTCANTPPLTPDSFNGLVLSPSFSSSEILSEQDHYTDSPQLQYQNSIQPGIRIYEEDRSQHIRRLSHSQEIKEGKKPQRPIVCGCTYLSNLTCECLFLIVL